MLEHNAPLTCADLPSPATPDTPKLRATPQGIGARDDMHMSGRNGGRSKCSVDILNLATMFGGDHPNEVMMSTLSSVAKIVHETLESEIPQGQSPLLWPPDSALGGNILEDGGRKPQQMGRCALPTFLLGSTSVEVSEAAHSSGPIHVHSGSRFDIGAGHAEEGTPFSRTQVQGYSDHRLHKDLEAKAHHMPKHITYIATQAVPSSGWDDGPAIEPFDGEDEEVLAQADYPHLVCSARP